MNHDEMVDLVVLLLREIVGGQAVVTARSYLFDLPGFDSIALADLVGELEAHVGPLPDEVLVPEVFRTATKIATAVLANTSPGRPL
jgi:acyl carrier protein